VEGFHVSSDYPSGLTTTELVIQLLEMFHILRDVHFPHFCSDMETGKILEIQCQIYIYIQRRVDKEVTVDCFRYYLTALQ